LSSRDRRTISIWRAADFALRNRIVRSYHRVSIQSEQIFRWTPRRIRYQSRLRVPFLGRSCLEQADGLSSTT
jgi:hypothetical protein